MGKNIKSEARKAHVKEQERLRVLQDPDAPLPERLRAIATGLIDNDSSEARAASGALHQAANRLQELESRYKLARSLQVALANFVNEGLENWEL